MCGEHTDQVLPELFSSKTVVDLPTIREALGSVSHMTAFRRLGQVSYRRSYNHNGRYYTLYEPSRYDRFGLWSWGDIHFSVDGSLKCTVCRLVHEAEAGATHRELRDRLRTRVHNTLLDLLRNGEIDREQLAQIYVYVHVDSSMREAQLRRRREMTASETVVIAENGIEVGDQVIIEVLLVLIRRPGSTPAEVVRHLRGHSPPITHQQILKVFALYDLDNIGEKGGP